MGIQFKLEGEWPRFTRATGNLQRNLAQSSMRIQSDEKAYVRRTILPKIMFGIGGAGDPYMSGRRRITRVLFQQVGPTSFAVGVAVEWERLRPEFAKGAPIWQVLNRKQQRQMFGLFLRHGITKTSGDMSKLTMFDPMPYIAPVLKDTLYNDQFYGRAQVSWQRSASRIW